MNIFLSGSTGFVGKNLKQYMSYQPDAFSLQNIVREDLLNSETHLVNQFNENAGYSIIHLAGIAHDLRNTSGSDVYYEVNFEFTKKIYNAFLISDARVFIFVSSVKAVADSLEGILSENVQPNPKTHYGKSKLLAEEYIQNQILPTEKSYFIIRPCMIHGSGNKGNLNLLYRVAKLGVPYPLAAFENRRSFLSVENLCFVIKELIERNDIPSGIYNIADDEPLSTNRLIQIMSETISKKPRLWKINKSIIKVIAKIGDILPFPLNSERLQKLTESYVVSNAKLKSALNKPLPLSSEEGLRRTIQSFMHDQ